MDIEAASGGSALSGRALGVPLHNLVHTGQRFLRTDSWW